MTYEQFFAQVAQMRPNAASLGEVADILIEMQRHTQDLDTLDALAKAEKAVFKAIEARAVTAA